jgi:hypothetical protein
MSQQSIKLDRAHTWDALCFPVEAVALETLLPAGYRIVPTDRKRAIVGELPDGTKNIFALQSGEYSLIKNELLREAAEIYLPDHTIDASFTPQGEFSINLILPDEINISSGSNKSKVEDRLYKSMIINNSYSGKTPFSLQGTALKEHIETETTSKMRVSYYRQVCTNGLMGWADDYMSFDQYLAWLLNGKPKKYKDALKIKDAELVERTGRQVDREQEVLVEKKFHHKGLHLDVFKKQLASIFKAFQRQAHAASPTVGIYRELAKQAAPENLASVITESGLPKMLARNAMDRLAEEMKLLDTSANLWLAYNAVNHALFNSRSSLSISDRFRLDEAAFHQLATLALT